MKTTFTVERDDPSTRRVIALLTAAGTAALPLAAQAGLQQGKVVMHHTTHQASASGPGLAFFVLEGAAKSSRPACNTFADRWVVDDSETVMDVRLMPD